MTPESQVLLEWIDIKKFKLSHLSSNKNAIDLLEKNPDDINWVRNCSSFGDSSTHQVFSNSFIMNFSSFTPIEIQVNLLNSPVNGATSVFVYDTFLERILISL